MMRITLLCFDKNFLIMSELYHFLLKSTSKNVYKVSPVVRFLYYRVRLTQSASVKSSALLFSNPNSVNFSLEMTFFKFPESFFRL